MLRRSFCALALARAALRAQAQPPKSLTIVKPALRQYEDGPAVVPPATFGAGETVFFTFQVSGYKVSPDQAFDLAWSVEVADPDGVPLVELTAKDLQSKLSPEDKNWMPIMRHSFMIPPIVLPGTYHATAVVKDRLGAQETRAEVPFVVRARKVEPSAALVTRNFRYVRSEEDPAVAPGGVYRPGDTVWARFDIIGYKFGERNRIHVEYGVAVADAAGKVLFQQPQAAVEEKETFYPQKYVPGIVSLTTQKNTRPGEYLLTLFLRDEVGKQAVEEKHPFRLE